MDLFSRAEIDAGAYEREIEDASYHCKHNLFYALILLELIHHSDKSGCWI